MPLSKSSAPRNKLQSQSLFCALDTNILVRYIAQDDAKQSSIATKLIEQLEGSNTKCVISTPVLIETIWVLKKLYKANKKELCQVIESLLVTKSFIIQNRKEIEQSLEQFKKCNADFNDCLIISLSSAIRSDKNGLLDVFSFDKKAISAGMTILK